jgi:hypothetical protein
MPILKLDLDTKKVDWKRIREIKRMFGLEIDFKQSRWAKTKNGFHIYLSIKNVISEEGLCFFQLAMGSDHRRECMNWIRITIGTKWQKENWNVLFSKKYAVGLNGKVRLASDEKELPISMLKERLK